jgi:diguanylate cyclase (GGDEF)-like protein
VPGAEVNGWSMTLVTGTQYGLTGLMLIHVADGVERTAGWFAGAICIAFASWNFVWYGMTLSTLGSMVQTSTYLINPGIRLVMNGGLALGFLMIAMSRLQVYLQRETERDELTGLMNLRGIRRVGALTIAECRRARNPISLLMIDLDGFKSTNDQLGHDAGDVLLCAVAKALVDMLRRKDNVARLGGDEFCLMLPETDEREAVQIAERCRSELHTPPTAPQPGVSW